MRKWRVVAGIFLIGMVFSACQPKQEDISAAKEVGQSDKGAREAAIVQPEKTEEKEQRYSPTDLWQADMHASTVLEDENAVYICGKSNIRKINQNDGNCQNIWESERKEWMETSYAYADSSGILLDDKIYFLERCEDEAENGNSEQGYTLSVVRTDGSGYECLEKNVSGELSRLLLLDGILYFEKNESTKALTGYPVYKDGNLIRNEKIITKAENVPDDFTEPYYHENGAGLLSPLESKKYFGYYLLCDTEYDLCTVNPKNGETKKLPGELKDCSLAGFNDEYLLLFSYGNSEMYLVDSQTLETRIVIVYDDDLNFISVDSDYVYYQKEFSGDDFRQYQYERISLENGNAENLFTMDAFVGMPSNSPWYLMNITLLGDYIYYVGAQDYKYYVMRRNVDMPGAEDVLGEAFYDTHIGNIGKIKTYRETIYSSQNPENVTGSLDLEWLVIDGRFPGAANINRILEEEQQANIAYERDAAKSAEEWMYEYEEAVNIPHNSFSSNVSPIYYLDDYYLSFVQQNYDYMGGAHGMPYWISHSFDLQSGEELTLADIISEDDAEVKGLVTQYFSKMYNENPDMYWENAVDYVFEQITLDSPFYLTGDGIAFYFGPYELASYAAGFQEILVPYSEFELKIPLDE